MMMMMMMMMMMFLYNAILNDAHSARINTRINVSPVRPIWGRCYWLSLLRGVAAQVLPYI